ncbi:substrate-binding periplasmic protein [Olsenella massiliensis]|uniref:substrate-binding periplasmic protein n=1 Tax=Olsenella massiliensis TaxID=1622075 RepID=UPI00071E22B9|nr:transporter substrate-binding domain-containing protein [Olsenella massiliensis]
MTWSNGVSGCGTQNTCDGGRRPMSRRSFLGLVVAGTSLAPLTLAGCGGAQGSGAEPQGGAATSSDVSGRHLTFVGDDAFAPYRYLKLQQDGTQKVEGLDIAVADEMSKRLGFSYDFEAQDFAATLASVQSSDSSFTMAMSANEERTKTYDFTRGYYQPRVGVLANGDAVTSIDALKGKSIACTTGTVQNKFVTSVMPDADVHTYDGGDQCLQEVLSGRIDAYVCDGAEGQAMVKANPGLSLGLLDRAETKDYVGVYRVMALKGASFVEAFDGCIGDMIADGTIDRLIETYVGADFTWGDAAPDEMGTSTVGGSGSSN